MRTNKVKVVDPTLVTHGGARASCIDALAQLERSVMSCLLWESGFYEEGEEIASRIDRLAMEVDAHEVAELAIRVRSEGNLRHVPLLLLLALVKRKFEFTADAIAHVIQRPDEMAELLSLYWKEGKRPLAAQLKKGLAKAFVKFDEYQLGKRRGTNDQISLRDIMFLAHPKPVSKAMAKVYKKLADNELSAPDTTWEYISSTMKFKSDAEKWEFIIDQWIGDSKVKNHFAIIRNLRNVVNARVDDKHENKLRKAFSHESWANSRILPYRFLTSAKYVPSYEPELEQAMFRCLNNTPKMDGKTILILDVSGSMGQNLSGKSDMSNLDAAIGLAILARELFNDIRIYATAGSDMTRVHKTALVPSRRGFALKDAVYKAAASLGGGGIFLTQVMDYVYEKEKIADRIIIFSDEQDTSGRLYNPQAANAFGKTNYLLNIATAKNGIAYNKFIHINGFSEQSIKYMAAYEGLTQ